MRKIFLVFSFLLAGCVGVSYKQIDVKQANAMPDEDSKLILSNAFGDDWIEYPYVYLFKPFKLKETSPGHIQISALDVLTFELLPTKTKQPIEISEINNAVYYKHYEQLILYAQDLEKALDIGNLVSTGIKQAMEKSMNPYASDRPYQALGGMLVQCVKPEKLDNIGKSLLALGAQFDQIKMVEMAAIRPQIVIKCL